MLIGIGAWIYCAMNNSSDTGETPLEVAALLDTKDSAPINQKVESGLGMKLDYNGRELMAFGFYDGTTFSGADLDKKRNYGVIRVRPVETNQAARSEMTLVSPELRVTSTNDKKYWDKLTGKAGYKDLTKLDALVKANNDQRSKDTPTLEIGNSKEQDINNNKYKKISYTNKDERYGVTSQRREDCYFTVQNDRPYIACIDNIRASNFSVVSQLEQVIVHLSYQAPDEGSLIDSDSKLESETMTDKNKESVSEADVAESENKNGSKSDNGDDENQQDAENKSDGNNGEKPSSYLASSKDFKIFASMAPATVRTGVLYCADIKLTFPNKKPGPQLTGACIEKAGSGFIISNDGMVATAASNINISPREAIKAYITNSTDSEQASSRLDRILQYMMEAKILMQTDVDAIMAGLSERNQDVIEKIHVLADMIDNEYISLARENYAYAVQTSNKPIVVNKKKDGNLEFAYSDDVLEAELIGKKSDDEKTQSDISKGDNLKNDVGILKLKNASTYPTIPLAASSTVAKNGPVNIEGLPMYTIGTLSTGQIRPSAMLKQGNADQVFGGADGQRLLVVSSPSHAGLTGGPAVNADGHAVGLATYNTAQCPGGECMASSVVRDISEVKVLAKDNNKSINSSSATSDIWNSAVSELIRGNYKKATNQFSDAARQYPQNYLASNFAEYARSKIGSETDTSNMNIGVSAAKVTVVVSVIVLIILLITRLAMRLFSRPVAVSQYGNMAGGKYIDTKQWQQSQAPSTPNYGASYQQPGAHPSYQHPQQFNSGGQAINQTPYQQGYSNNPYQQPPVNPQVPPQYPQDNNYRQ